MRLGLDIASYAADRSIDRIILITGDTDCLPAMKLARKSRSASDACAIPEAAAREGTPVALGLPATCQLAQAGLTAVAGDVPHAIGNALRVAPSFGYSEQNLGKRSVGR